MKSSSMGNGLDVRSLRILVTLLTECSVTRTAELIGQPQPAISLCLRRLRAIFNDPLLVRTGNRLVPTDRGRELEISMRRVLEDLDRELCPDESFDPSSGGHHFRLLLANCFGPTFLPLIISRINEEAPGAIVDVSPMPAHDQLVSVLADGVADIVLGNWPHPPEKLRTAPLFASNMVCLVHGRHPFSKLKRLTLNQYLSAKHLSLTPSDNAGLSPIDGRLCDLSVSRQISASVPDYGSVPFVLAQTDMVFTTSRHFAEDLAVHVPLSVVELPKEFGAIRFYALWHERNHRSPWHQWLRGIIRGVAREVENMSSNLYRTPHTSPV
ncbi:LysR family transcriptional regulator [uncultured Roseibium sp.]|uniref:LysR family transcriptional regulator n=1 Tax=uncultured Roseibium sp. TaxID=1936171 RepID=UPI0032176382